MTDKIKTEVTHLLQGTVELTKNGMTVSKSEDIQTALKKEETKKSASNKKKTETEGKKSKGKKSQTESNQVWTIGIPDEEIYTYEHNMFIDPSGLTFEDAKPEIIKALYMIAEKSKEYNPKDIKINIKILLKNTEKKNIYYASKKEQIENYDSIIKDLEKHLDESKKDKRDISLDLRRLLEEVITKAINELNKKHQIEVNDGTHVTPDLGINYFKIVKDLIKDLQENAAALVNIAEPLKGMLRENLDKRVRVESTVIAVAASTFTDLSSIRKYDPFTGVNMSEDTLKGLLKPKAINHQEAIDSIIEREDKAGRDNSSKQNNLVGNNAKKEDFDEEDKDHPVHPDEDDEDIDAFSEKVLERANK